MGQVLLAQAVGSLRSFGKLPNITYTSLIAGISSRKNRSRGDGRPGMMQIVDNWHNEPNFCFFACQIIFRR